MRVFNAFKMANLIRTVLIKAVQDMVSLCSIQIHILKIFTSFGRMH